MKTYLLMLAIAVCLLLGAVLTVVILNWCLITFANPSSMGADGLAFLGIVGLIVGWFWVLWKLVPKP